MKTAIIIGATGATGRNLLNQLLSDPNFSKIKIFIRRDIELSHPKLEKFIVDFKSIECWKENIVGDILFSALGTTLKQAKSKKNQHEIDYGHQYSVAKQASLNGVKTYVLVSAFGAKSKSPIFYSRMKGELEEAITPLDFEKIHIFQPGILKRLTKDHRFFENLSVKMIESLNKIGILHSQKPLPVNLLAEKMIKVVQIESQNRVNYYRLSEIFNI